MPLSAILFINFIHRDFDSPCNTIFSDCTTLTFLDDDSFDHTLSDKLKKTDRPLEITFNNLSGVSLPEKKLTLKSIGQLKESSRVLKWLIASKENTYQDINKRERFVDPASILSGLSYAITLYDAIKAVILYKPASHTRAKVYYSQNGTGKKAVEKIVFIPYREK